MILIADKQAVEANGALLEAFDVLYTNGFPDPDERESFEGILQRVASAEAVPRTAIVLHLDPATDKLLGGVVADWYGEIGAIHLIYLIVDERVRRGGIARLLIDEGVKMIVAHLKKVEKVKVKNLFFESNNPLKTEVDNFDPQTRLRIFTRLGARMVPVTYVQPPLEEGMGEVDNLLLLSFCQFNATGGSVPAEDIKAFLKTFYCALNPANKDHPALRRMESQLDYTSDDEGMVELESVVETPAYNFTACSITQHYIEQGEAVADAPCDHFYSFETDLLNYQNQTERPISTAFRCFEQKAELLLPALYGYTSEGISHPRLGPLEGIPVVFSISRTAIGSDAIVHFTVAPAPGSGFSELDIIKLCSVFASKQERVDWRGEVAVKVGGVAGTIPEVVQKCINARCKALGSGVVQVDTMGAPGSKGIFNKKFVKDLVEDKRVELDGEVKELANAMCGIVLGIFDFNRMDDDEIYDTIISLMPTDQSIPVLCRGSLVKFSGMKKLMTAPPNLIVSPYLLLPNTVLAYNRFVLDRATGLLNEAMREESTVAQLEACRVEVGRILNSLYLSEVFQYPSEQKIVSLGNKQRGIEASLEKINNRVRDLSELIEFKHEGKSNFSDAVLNAILAALALMQVKSVFFDASDFSFGEVGFYLAVVLVGLLIFRIVRSKL